jgi:electron transfer flavoprotein beta subunit
MHLVVLLKRVLDPEIPQSAFSLDPQHKEPSALRHPFVLSVFDGNALELALRLRDTRAEVRVTALTLGPRAAEDVLRKALALTVDEAVHIVGDEAGLPAGRKARVLAAAIRRLAPADLVLCGRQAADWEAGQLGGMLAEALGLPCLPFVSGLGLAPGGFEAVQQVESGQAVYRVAGPAVLTVTNDPGNVLRPARIRDVMAARGRELTTIPLADLVPGTEGDEAGVETLDLRLPTPRRRAEILDGGDAAETAARLARRLRELGAV